MGVVQIKCWTAMMYSITAIRHLHGYIISYVFAINKYCILFERGKGTAIFETCKQKAKKLSLWGESFL